MRGTDRRWYSATSGGAITAIGYVRVATGPAQADKHAQDAGRVAIDGLPQLLRRFHGTVNCRPVVPAAVASGTPGGEQITFSLLAGPVHRLHAVAASVSPGRRETLSVVPDAALLS